MFTLPLVEVAISLSLLYLFFSQVVLSVFEWLAGRLNLRGRYLRRYLNEALNSGTDKNWAELMYRHPSVDMLAQKANRTPAYVPSSVFVKAIVDLVIDEVRMHEFVPRLDEHGNPVPGGERVYQLSNLAAPDSTALSPLQQLKAGVARLSEGDFKVLLRTLLFNAEGCQAADDANVFEQFLHGLAVWYDDYMERVSGWYKRYVRPFLFAVGLVIAVVCNLDSLRVGSYLWRHTAARQRIVAFAEMQARDSATMTRLQFIPPADTATTRQVKQAVRRYASQVDSLTRALQGLGFPIGWSFRDHRTTLDTLYRAIVPASVAGDWQPQPYWVRYVLTTFTRPLGRSQVLLRHRAWQPDTLHALRTGLVPVAEEDVQQLAVPLPKAATGWLQPDGPWLAGRPHGWGWGWAALGWLLTAAALSFGAPFWFQLLNQFVNMRSGGLRPPSTTVPADGASTSK
ncbi:hypothetical protein ACVWYF_001443 [Hymenobacter sp. UYAg731]